MDVSEAAKIVIDKISNLEPENVARKIIGYIFFQEFSEQEMIRLALGPECLIQNLIEKAKTARLLAPGPPISPPIGPLAEHAFQFTAPFSPASPLPLSSRSVFNTYSDSLGIEDAVKSGYRSNYYYPEAAFSNMGIRGSRNSVVKTCHYFMQGLCKHGSSCRYFHGESSLKSYPHAFGSNPYEDDQVFSPRTLKKVEMEIIELLKSRHGVPLSIALLPTLYYEKYGKVLEAEGYLTESQRHGKPGYSLTKLLSRLKNSIQLIDRPHGQHAVILAEDAFMYMDFRNDPGHIVTGSLQIYLTFPAESTFTEEDVSNYFSTFGQVHDVRIPCQQKRMFGFVTFVSADTVKTILSKGNPHYVCDARVLVKPYREKPKLLERKYLEKLENRMHYNYNAHSLDIDSGSLRMFRQQLIEHKHALELETRRLSQLQLSCKNQSYFSYSMGELEDHLKFPSEERFNHLLDVFSNDSTRDDNPTYPANCGDQESSQAVANSVSTVM